MAAMLSAVPAADWGVRHKQSKCSEDAAGINPALAKTFRTAVLLTGGVRQAEAAMLDAIQRMGSEQVSDDTFLLDCVRASLVPGRQSKAIEESFDSSISKRELIGASSGLRRVWDSLELVARTDSPVLIQGETGTGKEIVAKAIHEGSLRKHGPFVKVNCAAIPGGLLESELFGHERGAFTGALNQTSGRFQLAHSGTLFLDEIGDLPLEMQPKLLRVLQEHEFERLGSARTIRVDVRIVAATNQDLAQMVEERRFRADLYYRLNVFPIDLPPLRERAEDIPLLAHYFVSQFASQMNKEVRHISEKVMETLQMHDWPGNIRELQNVIERAVILSSGTSLHLPPEGIKPTTKSKVPPAARTLAEAEREHILKVLREVGGVVGGRKGAAARLGLPRTTLIARMHKLGIVPGRAERPAVLPVWSSQKDFSNPTSSSEESHLDSDNG